MLSWPASLSTALHVSASFTRQPMISCLLPKQLDDCVQTASLSVMVMLVFRTAGIYTESALHSQEVLSMSCDFSKSSTAATTGGQVVQCQIRCCLGWMKCHYNKTDEQYTSKLTGVMTGLRAQAIGQSSSFEPILRRCMRSCSAAMVPVAAPSPELPESCTWGPSGLPPELMLTRFRRSRRASTVLSAPPEGLGEA